MTTRDRSTTPPKPRNSLTVPEAAKLLRVSDGTLYRAIRRDELPGVIRIGRAIRLHREKLLEWFRDSAQTPKDPRLAPERHRELQHLLRGVLSELIDQLKPHIDPSGGYLLANLMDVLWLGTQVDDDRKVNLDEARSVLDELPPEVLAAGIRECALRAAFEGDHEFRILFNALGLDQAELRRGR